MSVITGQGVTAYPLPDEELSPTSKNAVSNEAVCEGLDEIKNTFRSRFNGKKISIIGDSIDTYDQSGYKIDGYNMYYPTHGVNNVNKTWWKQVIDNSGAQLEINASWSGSRVTNTHSDPTYPDLYDRISVIGSPDIIFITLGTNDANNGVALGEYDYDTPFTSDATVRSKFRNAYINGIKGLKASYPNADIVCISEMMASNYKESIINICNAMSCYFIDASDYIRYSGVHPGVKGMLQIASMVLYPTDQSMSQKHVPADARTIGYIEENSDAYKRGSFDGRSLSFEVGSIGGQGQDTDSTTNIRSISRLFLPKGSTFYVKSGIEGTAKYFKYLKNGTLDSTAWLSAGEKIEVSEDGYYRFAIAQSTDISNTQNLVFETVEYIADEENRNYFFSDVSVKKINELSLFNSQITIANGSMATNKARVTSLGFIGNDIIDFVIPSGYECLVFGWENDSYIGSFNPSTQVFSTTNTMWVKKTYIPLVRKINKNANLRVVFRKTNGADFTASDLLSDGCMFYAVNTFDNGEKQLSLGHLDKNNFVFGSAMGASNPYGMVTYGWGKTRCQTNNYIKAKKGTTIKWDNSKLQLMVAVYDEEKTVENMFGFYSGYNWYTAKENCYMRFIIAKTDNSDMTESDIWNLCNLVKVYIDCSIPVYQSHEFVGQTYSALPAAGTSALTFFGDKLVHFNYNSSNDPGTNIGAQEYDVSRNGVAYNTALNKTYTHNTGHANTVDYSEKNGCLIIGNGGSSSNTNPNKIYIFKDAINLSAFDVASENCLTIDVSSEDWGKQLNCVWGDDNLGEYNIIYCITNYEQGNMSYYAEGNPNRFTGESKRFLRRVLLGKGSNDLGHGTMISGVSANEFNGTYLVLNEWNFPFVVGEANNDTCFYNGKIYELMTNLGSEKSLGIMYKEYSFSESGRTCSASLKCFLHYNASGSPVLTEGEGIAIKDGLLFTVSANGHIYSFGV